MYFLKQNIKMKGFLRLTKFDSLDPITKVEEIGAFMVSKQIFFKSIALLFN